MEPLNAESFKSHHDAVVLKLSSLLTKLKYIYEKGNAARKDSSKLPLFNGIFKEAKSHYDHFNAHWESNIELYCRASKTDEFPSDGDKSIQNEAETYYYHILVIHDALNPPKEIDGQPKSSVEGASSLLSQSNISTNRSRLPKINLIKFNGDFSIWPLFRDTFTSLVHEDQNIPRIEKFHYLFSLIFGRPCFDSHQGYSTSGCPV